MKKSVIVVFSSLGLFPLIASAQNLGGPDFGYFGTILNSVRQLLDTTIPILIGIGMVIFFWGLVQYIRKPEAEQGRKIMVAGLVGLFIMVSVWGIIRLGQNVLRIGPADAVPAPNVPQ